MIKQPMDSLILTQIPNPHTHLITGNWLEAWPRVRVQKVNKCMSDYNNE